MQNSGALGRVTTYRALSLDAAGLRRIIQALGRRAFQGWGFAVGPFRV